MEVAAESALLNPSTFFPRSSPSFLPASHPQIRLPTKNFPSNLLLFSNSHQLHRPVCSQRLVQFQIPTKSGFCLQIPEVHGVEDSITSLKLGFFVNRRIVALAATVIGVLVFGCRRVFAVEGVVDSGYGVIRTQHIVIEELLAETFSGSLGFQRARFDFGCSSGSLCIFPDG